jgi:biotin synthase
MCLTIPAKVIKLEANQAVIRDNNSTKKISILLVPDLRVGDWVLYIGDLALQKISKSDAQEIMELLESSQKIDISKLSQKFKRIIQSSQLRQLNKKEIIYLLKTEGIEKEALFSEANVVRKNYLADFICIHGIIEFSNYCKNDCLYCGLRVQNKKIKRYRLSVDEIVKTAINAVNKKGYKLLILQSGDDDYYSDEMLCQIIKKIKARARVFIFMSVGERDYEGYKKMKEAGASGMLFRFETSNQNLFKKLHPKGKDFKKRFDHLKFLKKLGYFIATGFIVGLPGQTIEDLADDILKVKKWGHMISIGPFAPCDNTPLFNSPQGDVEMNLKMIAILRLLMKKARIPVVTALETLAGEEGRKRALRAGANSLMLNLTPAKFRSLYKIYPNKFYQNKSYWEKYGLFKYEESYNMLEERMQEELINSGL